MMKKRIFWTVLSICISLTIFILSSDTAPVSSEKSGFIMQLLESLHIHLSEHMIRKMAHFAIYALLSISYIQMLKSYQCRRYALYGIIMAVLFAATDEFHQTFVSGRSGEFGDIVIDSMGILLGYLLTVLTLKNPLGKSS